MKNTSFVMGALFVTPLTWMIMGLLTLRTGAVARVATLGFIAGSLITYVAGFVLPESASPIVWALTQLPMAAGFGILGYALWRPTAVATEPAHHIQPAPAGA